MIEAYAFGRMTVDGRSYTKDLIVFPDHVEDNWWREQGHVLGRGDLQNVFAAAPDVLVVGQGSPGRMEVPKDVARDVEERGIELFVAPTPEAVDAYNLLAPEKRAVGAFHLTC